MRGKPRTQYARTYVLLPQDCSPEWPRATIAATWEKHKYTVGASADDAGIGDLDVRHVIAVNPHKWSECFETGMLWGWFDRHYPGVQYIPVYADDPTMLISVLQALDDGPAPPTPTPPPAGCEFRVGLHDQAGAEWMRATGHPGIALVHNQVQDVPIILDTRPLAAAGIDVYWRINWGYGAEGTLPPPAHWPKWIETVTRSIRGSKGLAGVHIGNEINNPAEWVGGYPNVEYTLNPAIYVDLYNQICDSLDDCPTPMAPAPIDPYNVVAGRFKIEPDPRDWARYIYASAHRIDWIALHAKTQGSDPAECVSRATFTDPPLIGRHMHLATIEDQLDWIPLHLTGKPVLVTELNPQRRRDQSLGWDPDAAVWIREAKKYLVTVKAKTPQLAGAIFYRFERAGKQAPYGLRDQMGPLRAIFE